MSQQNEDQINQLDEVLDQHENEEISYIGKTFLYRCVDCGEERLVKGDKLNDVICEECGGEMQIIEEDVYDEAQDTDKKVSGKTELEKLQDETGENLDLTISDENNGSITDLSETDEVLESIDLELDLEENDIEQDGVPEDDELSLEEEDANLSVFSELIPDEEDEKF